MKSKIIEPSKLLDIHPNWENSINLDNTDVYQYRNLQHFKHHVQQLTQKEDTKCGISYAEALKGLLRNTSTMTQGNYEIIKNRVKENLHNRGLISDTIYKSYKYDVQGDIIDVAKVIAQDPMCCLVPNKTYTNYFYELYITSIRDI